MIYGISFWSWICSVGQVEEWGIADDIYALSLLRDAAGEHLEERVYQNFAGWAFQHTDDLFDCFFFHLAQVCSLAM